MPASTLAQGRNNMRPITINGQPSTWLRMPVLDDTSFLARVFNAAGMHPVYEGNYYEVS